MFPISHKANNALLFIVSQGAGRDRCRRELLANEQQARPKSKTIAKKSFLGISISLGMYFCQLVRATAQSFISRGFIRTTSLVAFWPKKTEKKILFTIDLAIERNRGEASDKNVTSKWSFVEATRTDNLERLRLRKTAEKMKRRKSYRRL